MDANGPKLITLSCPSCGAKLNISPDLDRFACAFCGQEHIVNRTGGTISLSPVVEAIHQVQTGVDKTAAELAIVRIREEINKLRNKRENIRNNHPEPRFPIFPIIYAISISIAILILISSLVGGKDSSTFNCCIILSPLAVIFFFIGVRQIIELKQEKIDWEKSIPLIKDINGQIAEKKIELERNQNIVRN